MTASASLSQVGCLPRGCKPQSIQSKSTAAEFRSQQAYEFALNLVDNWGLIAAVDAA